MTREVFMCNGVEVGECDTQSLLDERFFGKLFGAEERSGYDDLRMKAIEAEIARRETAKIKTSQ